MGNKVNCAKCNRQTKVNDVMWECKITKTSVIGDKPDAYYDCGCYEEKEKRDDNE